MYDGRTSLPVEIIQLIVGYMEACLDYMHARQIDRQFRYACLTHKLEAKFVNILNNQFFEDYSFKQLIGSYPGLLWCRFIKTHKFFFLETLKTDNNTYLWTDETFPFKRDHFCVWGLTTPANSISEGALCRSCLHGQLVIVSVDKASKKNQFERLFAIDISVPGEKVYNMECACWVEYEEDAAAACIPFKYINLFSQDYQSWPCSYPKSQLIRMVDVWHTKRLDIYLTWDTPFQNPLGHRFVATTFSKYGLLILTCCRDFNKFLLVGRPQYIGDKKELDMSQLFDYFYYIISKKLATLVEMHEDYTACDYNFFRDNDPPYYPLIRDHWFGSVKMFFHLPSQITVPTYEQFVARRSKGAIRSPHCQTDHMSLNLDIRKQDFRALAPDVKIYIRNILMRSPFCNHMFIFCLVGKDGLCDGIIDVRPSSLDFTIKTGKIRVLKVPYGKIKCCLDDYMIFHRESDKAFCYHKLETASLLYDKPDETDRLLAKKQES